MSESLAEAVARDWELRLGEPYPPGAAGYVVRAELADGTPAVLKLQHTHREDEQEADALERWDGDGAIRLLRRDEERHALLLERCEPGTPLSQGTADPVSVLIGLLPRLWKDATGFRTLAEETAWWLEEGDISRMPPSPQRDTAIALARELAPTQGELVLVHQDLHGDNVIASEREPWLVIDPKPLAAEREFAVAPIVRSGELGHSKREALYRLDRLCSELGLDRERACGWTIVQTVAWSEGAAHPRHGEVVEWLS
ncbi:MAG TPA: aminoglycoside phosphotransferase family protein [Gaiellaceae bacterium]|jgi:streptomycin 6-kinase